MRTAFSPAYFLWFHLTWLRPETVLLGQTSEDWIERYMRLTKYDVVVAISTGRCVRRTIEIVTYARERGARIVRITDSYLSALGQLAHPTLLVPVQGMSGYETYVPALSLINALIAAVSLRRPDRTEAALRTLENAWGTYRIMAGPPAPGRQGRARHRRVPAGR